MTKSDLTAETTTRDGDGRSDFPPPEALPQGHRSRSAPASEPDELEQLRRARERDQFLELLRRTRADFENYQKRARREREKERRYQHGPIVLDLLPVLDNLEWAIAAAEQAGDNGPLTQGIRLVRKMFLDVLQRHAIAPVQSLGRPFDPRLHHAVMTRVVAGQPANTVVDVVKEGYCLHDRLLRPAEVVVSVSAESHE
jgi:molecular chaperone GrpE